MDQNIGNAGITDGTDGADAPESPSNGAAAAFVDARVMHAMALERLEAADIRDAETTRMLRQLSFDDPLVRPLSHRYSTARDQLHGDCFYSGRCEPVEETLRLIRETSDYIADAERLAADRPG